MNISIVIGGLLTGILLATIAIVITSVLRTRKAKKLYNEAKAREALAKARYDAETEWLHRAKAEQDRRRKEKERLDAIFDKVKGNVQPRAVKQALSEDAPTIRPLPKNNHQTPTQNNVSDDGVPNTLYNDYTPASMAYWTAMNASNNDSSSSSTDTSTSYSTDTSSSSGSDSGSSYDSGSSSSYDSGSSSSYDSGSSWGGGDSGGSGSF